MFKGLPFIGIALFYSLTFQQLCLYTQSRGNDSLLKEVADTLVNLQIDSFSADSAVADTMLSDDAIESKLYYRARDSIVIDVRKKIIYLYGESEARYEDITLKAHIIAINADSSLLYAHGIYDSAGHYVGRPEFSEGENAFTAHSMKYNYQTKKGKIIDVVTQDGESYVHGKEVKRMPDEILYIRRGKYTTCSMDTPHFYIHASRLKVIPDEWIVTGPAYMVVNEVPTPLAVPFGLFPNKKGKSSGIIVPTYGESPALGFYLLNGGYYWSISDKIDVALTGDIYSKGSWGTKMASNYRKRYKYQGNVSFSYAEIRNSYPEFPDFNINKEFFVRWNYVQDAKARPNSNFGANVNFGTSGNFRNNFNSVSEDYLTNTFTSSINYSKNFVRAPLPLSLVLSARHNQNTQTRQVNVSLPDAALNVARIYPFKNMSSKVGGGQWYKNIGISYTANLKNEISAYDSLITFDRINYLLEKRTNHGVSHSIPLTTSFKVQKYVSVTPSVNYYEKWYLSTIRKQYDTLQHKVITDTIAGFARGATMNYSVAATTKLYGTFNFRGQKIKALRHVITPSLGFSYLPDMRYDQRKYYDYARQKEVTYSAFEKGIFGTTTQYEAGLITYSLLNNFEMKVRQKKDSVIKEEKIKIFENIALSGNYNVLADSMPWSDIQFSGRSYVFRWLVFTLGGTLTPYRNTPSGQKINKLYWDYNKTVGRWTSFSIATSFSLNHQQFTQKKIARQIPDSLKESLAVNPQHFIDFEIPWNLFINYNFNYSKPNSYAPAQIANTVGISGDLKITENWKIAFQTNYDLVKGAFGYTTFDIYRDLHCWEMSFTWVPFGARKSYMVRLNAKSPLLQDLKITRKREYYDLNSQWMN